MATINGPFDFTNSFGNMRCYWDPAPKNGSSGKKAVLNVLGGADWP